MWILIPIKGHFESWVGRVSEPTISDPHWRIEAIKSAQVKDINKLASFDKLEPFDGRKCIAAFLNHHEPCTLVEPFVTRRNSQLNLIGGHGGMSTIEGGFGGLLRGIAVEEPEKAVFSGFAFDWNVFDSWYGQPNFANVINFDQKKVSIEGQAPRKDVFAVKGLGTLTVYTGTELTRAERSSTIRNMTRLRCDFDGNRSLDQVIECSSQLILLFGFLSGISSKPPVVRILQENSTSVGRSSGKAVEYISGFGGWTERGDSNRFDFIHINGIGEASLTSIVEKFFKEPEALSTNMYAVEFCRHFSRVLVDSFATVMPVLERHLKSKYCSPDEQQYMSHKEEFFDWIKSSSSENVREFSRKHVKVTGKKEPSLRVLLRRGIENVNGKGFNLDLALIDRICDRRARQFHGASIRLERAQDFYDEVNAACLLLMIETMEELGIDPSSLASRKTPLQEYEPYLYP